MAPLLTCATCDRPFAGRLAHRTDDGYVHVKCPQIPPTKRAETLPFAPLEPWWRQVACLPNGKLRKSAEAARSRGTISIRTADRIAIAIGLHPGLIWGDLWWLPATEEAA